VRSPETREETRSLPALAQTMVLWAPDTAGPWSAVIIRHISRNLHAYGGNLQTMLSFWTRPEIQVGYRVPQK